MKKTLCVLTALLLAIILAGCAGKPAPGGEVSENTPTVKEAQCNVPIFKSEDEFEKFTAGLIGGSHELGGLGHLWAEEELEYDGFIKSERYNAESPDSEYAASLLKDEIVSGERINSFILYKNYMIIETEYLENSADNVVNEKTAVWIYNIAEKNAPSLISTYVQSGEGNMYIADGRLCLATHYADYDEDGIQRPVFGEKGNLKNIPAERIAYFENANMRNYTVVGSVDIESGKSADAAAVLGTMWRGYFSENAVYASDCYYESESAPLHIIKIKTDGGKPEIARLGTIDVCSDPEFAMNEYDGELRVVLEEKDAVYEETADGRTTDNLLSPSVTRIYTLDGDMNIIGKSDALDSIDGIYAVKFSGNTATICDFDDRAEDWCAPTHQIDFTDSKHPAVSELK